MNSSSPSAAARPFPLRIFLLDDNAIDRETCRRYLARTEMSGYEFREHNSVDGALEQVIAWQPDCILLDYHLHDGTGVQFLQTLATIGGPRRFPVVMLTGTGSERIAVEVMKIGAQDYLSKDSLNGELLHRTIEGAIYRAHTERLLDEQRTEMERLFREAQEANARKDQFLATLSHELRTPLTPVLAAVSQADFAGVTTQEFIDLFAMIRRNIEVEARLIDDLLDLTRISSGKLQIHPRPVDPHEVLRHAAEACAAERKAKNIHLEWRLTPEPVILQADAGRIQQVFWNLLKNAVKFTPPDGTITLRSQYTDGHLVVEVADTGIGVPAEDTEKIFDAFEQGGPHVTKTFGGLGLGLAISKALVVAHAGSIHAANRSDGTGALFTVTLPCGAGRPLPSPAVPPPLSRPDAAPSGACVLLVEDHADSASVIQRLLTARGYRVLVASSVQQALEIFSTQPVDCLLSDLGLPDASGIELMEKIAAIRLIPAIALSGYGMENDVQRSLAAGFRQHLTKPIDVGQLFHALQSLLAER